MIRKENPTIWTFDCDEDFLVQNPPIRPFYYNYGDIAIDVRNGKRYFFRYYNTSFGEWVEDRTMEQAVAAVFDRMGQYPRILHILKGEGVSSLSVTVDDVPKVEGDKLYSGDVLEIEFSADTSYVASVLVNGKTDMPSGGTYTIPYGTEDISIAATAIEEPTEPEEPEEPEEP